MAEIQLTIDSRKVERAFFVFIILLLVGLNVYQFVHKPDIDQSVTGKVTQELQAQDQEKEQAAPVSAAPAETCKDGIKNQDETQVDCGGVCEGFWYDETCNPGPKPAAPAEIECRLNSDCASGFTCEEAKCIEAAPECEVDKDCKDNEVCREGVCELRPLSGDVEVSIEDVTVADGTGNDTRKVTELKLRITNGLSDSMTLFGKAYVYENANDDMYSIPQGGKFEIGRFKSGESKTYYYKVSGISFADDGDDRTVRVELYDDEGEQVDTKPMTITKKFEP